VRAKQPAKDAQLHLEQGGEEEDAEAEVAPVPVISPLVQVQGPGIGPSPGPIPIPGPISAAGPDPSLGPGLGPDPNPEPRTRSRFTRQPWRGEKPLVLMTAMRIHLKVSLTVLFRAKFCAQTRKAKKLLDFFAQKSSK
jgi:hypothetical protein